MSERSTIVRQNLLGYAAYETISILGPLTC
jgi:hypothetical protein